MPNYPKEVGKGKTQTDGTYIYTCNACWGTGKVGKDVCVWCYGLDVPRILEEMQLGARGQRYYGLLKAFLSVNGKPMVDCAKATHNAEGSFTLVEVAYISLKFGLNFKATCEWLEETVCIRAGTYDRIAGRFKVKDLCEKARAAYPDLKAG